MSSEFLDFDSADRSGSIDILVRDEPEEEDDEEDDDEEDDDEEDGQDDTDSDGYSE
jgi:hypothetical protein